MKKAQKNIFSFGKRVEYVSPKRAKDLLKQIEEKQSYFVCHKASIRGEEIVCKTFFDKLGHQSQMIRIAERLNAVQFVEQTNTVKLIPYVSMIKPVKKNENKSSH